MPLKPFMLTFIFLVVANGVSYSETSFNLLRLNQNSADLVSSCGTTIEIYEKKWIGEASSGIFHDREFYGIDHMKLLMTDLKSMRTEVLLNFGNVLDKNYRPFSVEYIDSHKIVVGAYAHDNARNTNTFYMFQYNRSTEGIQKIPINIDNGPISVRGKYMYYASKDGNIRCYDGTADQSLNIEGRSPTISPDGRRLAYIAPGWIRNFIRVYDMETKKTTSLISFFDSINPIIRWSSNSALIAMRTDSDLYVTPLYVLDSMTGEVVRKFEKSYARNWFFVDEEW